MTNLPKATCAGGDKLGTFLQAYQAALIEIFDQIDPNSLPYHKDRTDYVCAVMAKDGFFVAYQPYHESVEGSDSEPGVALHDRPDITLNEFCQIITGSCLRVSYRDLGSAFGPPQLAPPISFDSVPPGTYGLTLNRRIRETLKALADSGRPTFPLPQVQASPVYHYNHGVVEAFLPTRFKIWSPLVDVPGIGVERLYHWTHAELWWLPEEMDLLPSKARSAAFRDVMAAQVFSIMGKLAPGVDIRENAVVGTAGILREKCDEFLKLLESDGHKEEVLHQWLYRPEHRLFLDRDVTQVWSKMRFGGRDSDFVIRCSDGRYKIVEIERANLRIFTARGSEPTAEFNHACQQVRDWQRYIRDNVHTVRSEQKLDGIYEPRGVVIMGRSRDIDTDDSRKRWQDLQNRNEHDLFTYDDLCNRTLSFAASLELMATNL